jgi:hypothetical protein
MHEAVDALAPTDNRNLLLPHLITNIALARVPGAGAKRLLNRIGSYRGSGWRDVRFEVLIADKGDEIFVRCNVGKSLCAKRKGLRQTLLTGRGPKRPRVAAASLYLNVGGLGHQ